jgi:uncharacterized protein
VQPSAPSKRTTVHRIPKRAHYDEVTLHGILDEALVCHLGFTVDGQPFVIPTTFARVGRTLYVHGAAASRTLQALAGGAPACVTVTLLDGLVLARSAFHHSMNYRSAVIFGSASRVDDPAEIALALRSIVEKVAPGRYTDVRPPNEKELKATSVLRMPIDEASAKVRTGGPLDDEEDYAGVRSWAGVIPLSLTRGTPVRDDRLDPAVALPDYLA